MQHTNTDLSKRVAQHLLLAQLTRPTPHVIFTLDNHQSSRHPNLLVVTSFPSSAPCLPSQTPGPIAQLSFDLVSSRRVATPVLVLYTFIQHSTVDHRTLRSLSPMIDCSHYTPSPILSKFHQYCPISPHSLILSRAASGWSRAAWLTLIVLITVTPFSSKTATTVMAAKDNTQDGIELQEQPAHGAAASAASPGLTERLIDIGHVDDVADVEKGVPVGADTNVVSHLRTPSPQEDAVEAPVKNKSKSKKPAFLAAFNRESRSATIIFALMVVVAMSLAGVVAMAIVSSKGKSSLYPPAKPSNISLTECGADNQVIKELQEALGTTAAGVVHMAAVAATTAAATTIELRDGGYLQGVSGVLGDPSSLVQHAREAGAPDFFDAEATAL